MTRYGYSKLPEFAPHEDQAKKQRQAVLQRVRKQRSNWGNGMRGVYNGNEHQVQHERLLEALVSMHIIILQGNVPDIIARRAIRNLVVLELEVLRDYPDQTMLKQSYTSIMQLRSLTGITNLVEGLSPHLQVLESWYSSLEEE